MCLVALCGIQEYCVFSGFMWDTGILCELIFSQDEISVLFLQIGNHARKFRLSSCEMITMAVKEHELSRSITVFLVFSDGFHPTNKQSLYQ